MRQPVSTHGICSAMQDRIIWLPVLPGTPEKTQPGAAEDADCAGMPASPAARARVDSSSPCAGVARGLSEAGQSGAQAAVAGPSDRNPTGFSGLAGDRGEASIGGKLTSDQRAGAILPRLSPDMTGAALTCPRKAHDGLTIRAGRCAVAGTPAFHVTQAAGVVTRRETVDARSTATVAHADGLRRAVAIQSDHEGHGLTPFLSVTRDPAGRICGKLIARRSGGQPVTHQPVARFILPAQAARRVSRRPSDGEPPGQSRRDAGSRSLASPGASLPLGRLHR